MVVKDSRRLSVEGEIRLSGQFPYIIYYGLRVCDHHVRTLLGTSRSTRSSRPLVSYQPLMRKFGCVNALLT